LFGGNQRFRALDSIARNLEGKLGPELDLLDRISQPVADGVRLFELAIKGRFEPHTEPERQVF